MKLVLFSAFMQPVAFTFSNWARIVVYFSISLLICLPNFVSKVILENKLNAKNLNSDGYSSVRTDVFVAW